VHSSRNDDRIIPGFYIGRCGRATRVINP
jgi:hypothetical protein